LAGLLIAGEYLHELLAGRPDPAPAPNEPGRPEQVPLDHDTVKTPDALLRVDPVQHQVVLDTITALI